MDVTLPAVMTVDEVDAYLRIPRLGLQARTAGEDSLPEGGEALEVPEGGGCEAAGQRGHIQPGRPSFGGSLADPCMPERRSASPL